MAYALEAKIEEAGVLLKKQAIKAQGIYDAHLSATPMELSNLDMAPMERSNKMSLAKRSNQMALRDRCPQTVPVERRNQMALTYGRQHRGLQAVSDGHETKMGLFLELGDNSVPISVIPHHQDLWS